MPDLKLYHITPPLITCSEPKETDTDTSVVEPGPNEGNESDWVEVDGQEWSDERLMNDARPGRRTWVGEKASEVTPVDDKASEGVRKSPVDGKSSEGVKK
jgi:hypothetical protein